jgi:hypothetical protein
MGETSNVYWRSDKLTRNFNLEIWREEVMKTYVELRKAGLKGWGDSSGSM